MSTEANWEDKADEEPKLLVRKNDDRWQGEDEEEDVKDNWDDEDEEEDKSTGSEGTAKVGKKKVPLAVRIAEKQERKRRELEEKMRLQKEAEETNSTKTAEELLNEKLERQRLQEESDLFLAKESFGVDAQQQNDSSLNINLVSKEDFDEFRKLLVNKLQSVEKSQFYLPFLETAIRDVCVTLEADDIKKISNSLNALFNEKIKAQKTTKSKKKKGTSIKVEKTAIAQEYDDFEDYDEFM